MPKKQAGGGSHAKNQRQSGAGEDFNKTSDTVQGVGKR